MINIITRNLRTVSVENVNCFFSIILLIIHKEFLHGFTFLYISSIEGGSNSVISLEASGSWFTHQHLNNTQKFHQFIAMFILYLTYCVIFLS